MPTLREAAEGVLFWGRVESWGPEMSGRMRATLVALRLALDTNPPRGVCTDCAYLAPSPSSDGAVCMRIRFHFSYVDGDWRNSPLNPNTHSCAEWEAKEE